MLNEVHQESESDMEAQEEHVQSCDVVRVKYIKLGSL